MEPLKYLATLMSRIERLSKIIELEEEQVADWTGRASALEESVVLGMSVLERRAVERRAKVCMEEAERLEEVLVQERKELEELEEARAGLERAGFRVW